MNRRVGIAAAVATLAALAPAPASASVTASFDSGTRTVSVDLGAAGDVAGLSVVGTDIAVNGSGVPGGATVTSVDTIAIVDSSAGGDTTVVVDLRGGRFSPGFSGEAGGNEIELTLDAGGGTGDTLTVLSGDGGESIALGDQGIDLNVGEPAPGDADLTMPSDPVDVVELRGGAGADLITGAGGPGAGSSPTTLALELNGGRGEDELVGGSGPDVVDAMDGGRDRVACGEGADELIYDLQDTWLAQDCELTAHGDPFFPPPIVEPPPEPPGAEPPTVALSGSGLRVRRGRLSIRLDCAAPTGSVCDGTVSLHKRVSSRVRRLGRTAYRTQPGVRVKVPVRLNRLGRRLLRRRKRVRVTVRATVSGGDRRERAVTVRR